MSDVKETGASDEYFREAILFFKEYWWVLDFRWTEILVHNVLEKVPQEWSLFFETLTANEFRLLLLEYDLDGKQIPESLLTYLNKCNQLSLRLRWPLYDYQKPVTVRKNKKIAMKKEKEIESFLNVILKFCKEEIREDPSNLTILDVGSGLGYISEELNKNGFSVVGIEAQARLCHKANLNLRSETLRFIEMRLEDSQSCFEKILNELPKDKAVIVIGLHCCGDLLNTIINLYHSIPQVKALFTVTCCYHLITSDKFPRSCFLQKEFSNQSLKLSNVVKRVATQDPPLRWVHNLDESKLDTHTKTAYYRAVLEKTVIRKDITWVNPIKKKIYGKLNGSFDEFISSIKGGFDESTRLHGVRLLRECFEIHSKLMPAVNHLKMLQTLIQPVMESIIVLDHIIKLSELGYKASSIQCFSQLTSPRNICIISFK